MAAPSGVDRHLRPTGILPYVACGVLLIMQLISPADAWSYALVGLVLLLAIAYAWARMLRDAVVAERRMTGAWVVAGDLYHEDFQLVNRGRLPLLWARVRDGSAVPGYSADRVESAAAHSERTWRTTGVCERRGVFRVGPWDLEMGDPFGLFRVTQHHAETTTLMVYPRAAHIPQLELPRGRAGSRAFSFERVAQETITVGGVRDYVAGDSLRRIHWPVTAHRDRLTVREFDREPTGDLWLVVDMDSGVQAGHGSEATQEYAVVLAASLAARYAREGERRGIGLVASGRNPAFLPPARGQAQLWRILRALAEVEPGGDTPLASVLDRLLHSLGSGRTAVVITPSQDPAWVASLLALQARG